MFSEFNSDIDHAGSSSSVPRRGIEVDDVNSKASVANEVTCSRGDNYKIFDMIKTLVSNFTEISWLFLPKFMAYEYV